MYEPSQKVTEKLLELMESTGYPIMQTNGQRKFGPPPEWHGPPPPKGCEVFVGKLPREIFEDELVPLFSRVGKIYEMRLMMDFSGSNRGYAFVTYTSRSDAAAAVRQLNGFEIRPGRNIGVVKSVDNCRLYVGGIPKSKSKEEVLEELSKHAAGIVDVILYKNCYDRRLNRGFAFVEFMSHRAAAMARRSLIPGSVHLWDHEVTVDWAEPEPEVDDEQMKKVKVLYVRNLLISTEPKTIKAIFEETIKYKVEKVKKIYDYAFIHFYERFHAELAMSKLQNSEIDGVNIEIRWSKPVDRDLYKIQKMAKGNAKFNNGLDFPQTLMLYKQHLAKRDYCISSSKEDEGIGSACAEQSPCVSPLETERTDTGCRSVMPVARSDYSLPPLAPIKLEAMCRRYGWASPIYQYQSYEQLGCVVWMCQLRLPRLGAPLASPPALGPLLSRAYYSKQAATVEAAEMALNCLKMLRTEYLPAASPPPALFPPPPPALPALPALHPMPQFGITYDYMSPLYRNPISLHMWRAA